MDSIICRFFRFLLVYMFYSTIREPSHAKVSDNNNNCRSQAMNPSRYSFSFYVIVFLGFAIAVAPANVEAGFGDLIKDWVIDFAKDMGLTVYPNTHYCGLQSEDEDRPPESRIDKCCFYHDQCTVYAILSETKRYGIYNKHSYPIHPCECNDNFTLCLHQIDTVNAGLVANIYFDMVDECLMQSDNGTYYLVPQELEEPEDE